VTTISGGLWLLHSLWDCGVAVPGVVPLILVTSSLQCLALGIMGEYVGRIYDEVRDRPLYLVQDAHGFAGRPSK